MIEQNTIQPPSPTASDTSDDVYNQDNARVHFGPFKTPEKRLAAIVAVPDPEVDNVRPASSIEQSGQRSRSLSPSTSTASDEIMDVERLVGLGEEQEERDRRMNIGTPEPSGLPYDDGESNVSANHYLPLTMPAEPSSALASRLLRALDNPSPPPSPTLLPMPNDAEETEADGEDGMDSAAESETLPAALVFPPLTTTPQTTPPPSISRVNSEPDLMTFDSFDDGLEPVASLSTRPAAAAQAPPSPFSFLDDPALNGVTPHRTMESFPGRTDILVDVQDEATDVVSTEVEQQNGRQEDKSSSESSPSAADPSERPEPIVPASEPVLNAPPDPDDQPSGTEVQNTSTPDELPHTPLRRSSRPRKSATPHILKYLAATSPSTDQISPRLSTPRSSAETRKNRKGKERAMSPFKCDADMEPEDANVSKPDLFRLDERPSDVKAQRRYSRSPVRREFTRELGSLSPQSADFLAQLVPSAPATTTELASLCDPEPSVYASSSTSKQAPPSETPSDSSPNQNIQNPALSRPVTDSTTSNDTTRLSSPARVPSTPQRPYTPRSPSKLRLQSTPLDDPVRTPARRIPIEQAIAEGHVSPQKLSRLQSGTPAPVSIFTGQAMPVLNMSLKGDSSPARRVFAAPPTDGQIAPRLGSPNKSRLGDSVSRQVGQVSTASDSQKTTTSRPAKLPFPLVAAPKLQSSAKQSDGKSGESSVSSSPAKSSLKQATSRIPRKKPYSRPNVVPAATEQKTLQKPTTTRIVNSSKSAGASTSKKPTLVSRAAVVCS